MPVHLEHFHMDLEENDDILLDAVQHPYWEDVGRHSREWFAARYATVDFP